MESSISSSEESRNGFPAGMGFGRFATPCACADHNKKKVIVDDVHPNCAPDCPSQRSGPNKVLKKCKAAGSDPSAVQFSNIKKKQLEQAGKAGCLSGGASH